MQRASVLAASTTVMTVTKDWLLYCLFIIHPISILLFGCYNSPIECRAKQGATEYERAFFAREGSHEQPV